ncbi:MAG: OmpA family protein [Bacteroidota bacterium]
MKIIHILSLFLGIAFFTGCTYTEKIRDGQTAYDRMQYSVAVKLLEKEFNRANATLDKANKAYLLGVSFREMNENERSRDWFKNAYDLQYGPEALRDYAYALKFNEEYEKAAKVFLQVGQEMGNPYKFKKESEACALAAEWVKQKPDNQYAVELLEFNSKNSDYAPSLYASNQIVISSDRDLSEGQKSYSWYGNDFSDLFLIDLETNSISSFDESLNTEFNEGTSSFNADRSRVYFTRCGSDKKNGIDYCKIMYAIKKKDGSWSTPKIMSFVEGEVNYRHPFMSEDGNNLYFSSDAPMGFGGFDLYRVEKTDNGWSDPYNLGSKVNSEGNELFPFLDTDSLYFASDGYPGMGGLDIFKVVRVENKWRNLSNLKAPLNSGGDDFAFVINKEEVLEDQTVLQSGYFSSTRPDGAGSDDIYRFSRTIPPPPPPVEEPSEAPLVYKLLLEGIVLKNLYINPDNPNSGITGQAPLPNSSVEVNFGEQTIQLETDQEGKFFMELEFETDYNFLASSENYFNNTAFLSTKGEVKIEEEPVRTLTVEITLDKLFKNVDINLPNIYYDFDKWDIRKDAEPTLNDLVGILNNNPQIAKIQLSSHTDCRGSNPFNEELSQKRAQSAVDYLIKRGIAADRLSAKGYGEDEPEVDCACLRCTEEEHQQNRRTAFRIIE